VGANSLGPDAPDRRESHPRAYPRDSNALDPVSGRRIDRVC
jgi:hypothetical protein